MSEVIIRKAVPSDAKKIIEITVEVWNKTYKNLISQDIIDKLQYVNEERILKKEKSIKEKNNTFVAEIDGVIVGYSTYGKSRDENYKDSGEIYAGNILEDYQGIGLGRKLAISCIKALISDGYKTMITKCLVGNPSNEFHKSLGGKYIGKSSFNPLGIPVGYENIYYHENLNKTLEFNKKKIKK